jgi:hypothetical protein
VTSATGFGRFSAGVRRAAFVGILAMAVPALVVLTPGVATAAGDDATGTALRISLNGVVDETTVVFADATIGGSNAPPDGFASVSSIAAQLGPATGVTATGAAASSANAGVGQNQGISAVEDVTVGILGKEISASGLSGTATCPAQGAPTASTLVDKLTVFDSPVTATLNTTTTVGSGTVTVTGLDEASMSASVTVRGEQTTLTTATATAVVISLSLSGIRVSDSAQVTIPLGSVTIGGATCVKPPPTTITALDPAVGPVAGGQTVTVTGTGFESGGDTTVLIGGIVVPTGDITVTSPTSLTFITPPHAAGAVTVRVSSTAGTSGAFAYRYGSPPAAASLRLSEGSSAGGQTVTVFGSDFVAGETTVTIGGITIGAGQVDVVSPTMLRFRTPRHAAGQVDVVVTTPSGASSRLGFRYLAVPGAAALSPTDGPTGGGQTMTITGSGFIAGQTTVTIGGVTIAAGDVTVTSPTSLTFVTPAHAAGTVDVTVTTAGGTSDTLAYGYGELPFTGASTAGPIALGVLLLLVGAAALALGRRRRPMRAERGSAAG